MAKRKRGVQSLGLYREKKEGPVIRRKRALVANCHTDPAKKEGKKTTGVVHEGKSVERGEGPLFLRGKRREFPPEEKKRVFSPLPLHYGEKNTTSGERGKGKQDVFRIRWGGKGRPIRKRGKGGGIWLADPR